MGVRNADDLSGSSAFVVMGRYERPIKAPLRRGLDVTMGSRMPGRASVQITIDIPIHWLPKDSSEAATIGDAFLRGRRERPAPQ